MKNVYILLILLLLGCFPIKAQSVLNFTIEQLPALEADAGADTTIKRGTQIKLGGATAATGGSGTYMYSWAPSTGLSRSDIANPIAAPDSTITYTLTVNDAAGCSQSSEITVTVDVATGIINPITKELGLLIFPNPNNGTFIIKTEKKLAKGLVLLEIYDTIGKVLYSEKIDGRKKLDKTIRLTSQAKGMLILRFSGDKLNTISKVMVHSPHINY